MIRMNALLIRRKIVVERTEHAERSSGFRVGEMSSVV